MGKRTQATLLGLTISLAACGSPRRPNVVVTPAPSVAPSASAAVGPSGCRTQIVVGVVETRAGCEIDERVSGQGATVTHNCGDGPASASFADARFEGDVSGGQLDMSIETTFQFTDGCTWRTKQRIFGLMSSGELSYSYEEQPDPGQQGCARGCLAQARVRVD